jgi:hypothetical protein
MPSEKINDPHNDPRRIALIAIRTGSGNPDAHTGLNTQAIVVGEVPVADGKIVDPQDSALYLDFQWEWRYALFNLPDLERMFVQASRDFGNKKPWQEISHPLDGPTAFSEDHYWDQLGANPIDLLSREEKEDLVSSEDLSDDLRDCLKETIKPFLDDAGTTGPVVSSLNFAIPLRDVVRLTIYTKDRQPFGRDLNLEGGPLMVLDTCRFVKAKGSSQPERPTEPCDDPFGSRIVLFTDPRAVDKGGPNKKKKESAKGKLFGFAVFAQVRLPLNGHADGNNAELEKSRGLFRFYAINPSSSTINPVSGRAIPTSTGTIYPLFGGLDSPSADGSGKGVGPYFDRMRVGFTTGKYGEPVLLPQLNARRYSRPLPGYIGELSGRDARATDPGRGSKTPRNTAVIPIFDQLGIGLSGDHPPPRDENTSAPIRTLGFRFLAKNEGHPCTLGLRFEGNYWVTSWTDLDLSFAPGDAIGAKEQWFRFAQEQPLTAINWSLSPSRSVRWVFTARVSRDRARAVTEAVIDAFNEEVQQIYSGLRHTKDASPLSCLPILSAKNADTLAWHFVGSLTDREPYNGHFVISPNVPKLARQIDADFHTLEPRFIGDMWAGDTSPPMSLEIRADFQRLKMTSGENPIYRAVLGAPTNSDPSERTKTPWIDPPAFQPAVSGQDPNDVHRGVLVGIRLVEKFKPSDANVKEKAAGTQAKVPDHGTEPTPDPFAAPMLIGALELQLADRFPRDAENGTGTDGLIRLLKYSQNPDKTLANSALDALVKFPVKSALPGIQDELPSDAQITTEDRILDALRDNGPDPDAPLLIPLKLSEAGNVTRTLYANETVARHRNHTLELSLKAVKTGDGAGVADFGKLLVIDPAPFRIAVIKTRDIASGQTNESDEVAVWNAATGAGLSWRVVDDTETVSLLLPPQVIGEAMEKNRGDDASRPPDVRENVPAAARFGSLTRLDLDPSYFDTRYVEPGWNLRRLMGYAGQRAPGAGLRDLRLELMYGIMSRLTPMSPGVRIAEMGAVVGAPANSISADSGAPSVSSFIASFNRMRIAHNRRLAVDRLWQGNPLDDLTIEQGARFKLRTKRSLSVRLGGTAHAGDTASVTGSNATTTVTLGNANLTTTTGPLTPFRWPVPGDIPSDIDPGLSDTFSTHTDDAKSFPGGVPWAFESTNILRSVYRTLDGGGGRARGVHLSALGGWGNQRGLFDEQKTAIETETTMGRVHRYALERIGRIGALWNRAKHVIVYERSVVPSAQFYNIPPIGLQQDELLGRPVLRKVEEYVELLQPIRRYPEDGKTIEAAGCMTGVEFVSRRIRVDSRWGGDVRNEGWQVPLWNKAFDRPPENPNNPDDPTFVYPKPHISFVVMGEGNREKRLEIAEPEKLVFFTSTVPGENGDNTDGWHPVRDIDFVDLPPPQAVPPDPQRRPDSADLHDGLIPGEPPHVSGYERLTIGLIPSKDAVVLTHGRQDKGPAAVLHNVTLSRAGAARGVTAGSPPTDLAGKVVTQVTNSIVTFRHEFDKSIGKVSQAARFAASRQGATVESVKKAVREAAQALDLSKAVAQFKLPDAAAINTFTTKSPCDEQKGRVLAEINGQFNRANAQVESLFKDINDLLTAEVDQIHGIAAKVTDVASKERARDFLKGLLTRLDDLDRSVGASLSRGLANADALVAQSGGDVRSLIGAFDESMAEIEKRLDAVVNEFNPPPHPIPDKAFQDAISGLQLVRREVGKVLTNAASNSLPQTARTVLLVVDNALTSAQSNIANAQKIWNTNPADAKKGAEQAQQGIQKIIDALHDRNAIAKGEELVSNVIDKLNEIGSAAQTAISKSKSVADFKTALRDVIGKVDSLDPLAVVSRLEDLANRLAFIPASIRQSFLDAQKDIGNALDGVKTDLANKVSSVCTQFDDELAKVYSTAQAAESWIKQTLDGYTDRIDDALSQLSGDAEQIIQNAQDAVTGVGREMEARARELMGGIQQRAADYLGGRDPSDLLKEGKSVFQQGTDTLRLLRALGDPPKTDQLGFNRPEVAFVFQEANKIVDMTPTISLVNRVADSAAALGAAAQSADKLLTSFGIRLPTSGIGEQLMPDALKNLDISKLFPDFSGIKLDGLFKNLGFPSLSDSDAVKVRHGFDKTELTAWLEADVDVPYADSAPLIDFGPIQIMIDEARFTALARISEGRSGTQKAMHGQLFGDWRVVCAGQTILAFRQTGLTFDQSGRINFNIQPERVELAEALQFLTNLVKATGKKGDFEIVPYMLGNVPSGIAARLDMVLPPIQTGVFGISDLSLHVLFGVSALPEFEIITELAVGAKLAPFTLNVWILNGGGFLISRLSYLPTHSPQPLLMFTLEVGIVAGVGLGFSLGVVSGGVWVQVGCAIAITWTTGPGGSTTSVTVFLLVRGNVDVAGIITVGLSLLLAITHNGSQMIASGTLNLSIKISVFFELSVSEHVEYDFAGGKTSSSSSYSESYA